MDLEKKFSATDAITYCTEFIRPETDKFKYVSTVLLDLSKAFDSINHKILDEKLDMLGRLGYKSKIFSLIKSSK